MKSVAQTQLSKNKSVRENAHSGSLYLRLKSSLRRIEIDSETYYVAEGDTLLDEDQLAIYAMQREKADAARVAGGDASFAGLGSEKLGLMKHALIAITQGGKIVRWAPGQVLSYRVVQKSFPSKPQYDEVVAAMSEATSAWEATCGVEFEHRSDLDANDGVRPDGALFAVRHIDANGAFIASAFFPNEPSDRRRVLIDPSYFGSGFDSVGVLRHEMGHVLGFRHEHIHSSAPPACEGEDDFDVKYLTQYDPSSVMHYFCGGVGSKELKITPVDREGAQQVYGPPLRSMSFVTAD
ncbi:MAG: matrixin family metalloprotease [Terricaulis sp.]